MSSVSGSQAAGKLPRITAKIITAIGVALFITYLVYLPFPGLFQTGMADNVGLMFYCLATAGAGFVSWGIMLGQLGAQGISRHQVLRASAIGLGLLGLMRLATAVYPPPPFDQLILLPVSEFVVFTFVALKLYKS